MDIDALRKLNELTKALQQHGLGMTSQDAMTQAEQILHPIQEKTVIEQTQPKDYATEHNDMLIERRYKLLLEMNNKKFEETINTLQNNIHTLTQDIAKLKTEITSLDLRKSTTQQQTPPLQQTSTIPKTDPQQEQATTPPPQKKDSTLATNKLRPSQPQMIIQPEQNEKIIKYNQAFHT